MTTLEREKIENKYWKLIDELQRFYHPGTFDVKNYNPHIKRKLSQIHKLADILNKEDNCVGW